MKLVQLIVLVISMAFAAAAWAGPVNINTASASDMATAIQGVGEKKAQAIVNYRNEFGPFQSVDGLNKVKGIGAAIIEQNRDNLTVGQ